MGGPKVNSKGKKAHKPTKSTSKYSFYSVSGDKVERSRTSCPKCGPGVYMAQHTNRTHCGKCGFAEFKQA